VVAALAIMDSISTVLEEALSMYRKSTNPVATKLTRRNEERQTIIDLSYLELISSILLIDPFHIFNL
jgi:hypothetical protein